MGISIRSSYLICSSPRTGSNLLATTIRNTDLAGYPYEYFCPATLNAPFMLKLIGLPVEGAGPPHLASRFDRILARGTTPNGVFAATAHWGHLRTLLEAIGEVQGKALSVQDGALDGLHAFFPDLKFIWLYRENHVAQGLSHYIAKATKRWQETEDAPVPDHKAPGEPEYDFAAIQKFVKLARNDEEGWRKLLAACPDLVLPVSYEQQADNREATFAKVLAFLGVSPSEITVPNAPFRRQATARSVEWEARYRADEAAQAVPEKTVSVA